MVTGGGSTGIGGATARHFAEAGASRIALLGRREKPLLDNKAFIENAFPTVEVVTIPTDVTQKGEVDAAFGRFAAAGGGGEMIDVLVHCAVFVGPKDAVADVDGQQFLETICANVAGSLYVAQAFVRHAAPGAVAIDVNSWSAHSRLSDFYSAYGIAKTAVHKLWDTIAVANPGLSVFHTQPGSVRTELSVAAFGTESFKNAWTDDVSLPAAFNVWLASPEARFLKGKFVWCNWDVDELKAQSSEIEKGTLLDIGLFGWPFDKSSQGPWSLVTKTH